MTETNNVGKTILITGCVIGGLILLTTLCILALNSDNSQPSVQQVVTPTPTPAVSQVQPVYAEQVPSTLSFTALKANAAQANAVNPLDREYSVLTTNGDILVFSSYYSWDYIIPQQSYTCRVANAMTGYGRNVYAVTDCNVYRYPQYVPLQYPNDYSHYYDRNTGVYHEYYVSHDILYIGGNKYLNNMDNWYHNTHEYYHHDGEYWGCSDGICMKFTLTTLPSYVTIREEAPPNHHH